MLAADPAVFVPASPPGDDSVAAAGTAAVNVLAGTRVVGALTDTWPKDHRGPVSPAGPAHHEDAGRRGRRSGSRSWPWHREGSDSGWAEPPVPTCCGSGGYSDITRGSKVEIVNQDNEVLAVGTLKSGDGGLCSFKFTVIGVPEGERLYGAKIGDSNRGVIWHSEQEAKYQGFHLTLG